MHSRRPLLAALLAGLFLLASAPESAHARGGSKGSHGGGKSSARASGTGSNGASHGVRGHVRKDGHYVSGHRATNPNKTRRDNYSTKGNTNPYTGKPGTKNADR